MNYKSKKIFTKCCASILAVSNIFSGVSATPEEKPKKASDKSNQLSISKNELVRSILESSGFAMLTDLATFFFLRRYFFDTTEDKEEVVSMALALTKTAKKSKAIVGEELLTLCRVKSCKELLGLKGKDLSVDLNGNKYIYRVSCAASPYSANPTKNDNLLSNLKYCLFGDNDQSLSKLNWNQKLPFVIHLKSVSYLNAKRKSTVASVTHNIYHEIISMTKYNYEKKLHVNVSPINVTQKYKLKSAFYPDESANAAIINVGYWEKISSSSSAASSSSNESK